MKTIKNLTSVLVLFLSCSSPAQEICKDIFTSACGPDIINDGTGLSASVKVNAEMSDAQSKELEGKVIRFFEKNAEQVREQAFTDLALSCPKPAPDKFKTDSSCDAEIKTKLNDMVKRRQTVGAGERYPVGELRFMENTSFLNVLNEVNFQDRMKVDVAVQDEKVNRLFKHVKEALLSKIENSKIEPEKKKIILDRINRVVNKGSNCKEMFGGTSVLPKAFYSPNSNEFYMCRNFLSQTTSEFTLAYVMAHELTHSIDECTLRYFEEEKFGPTSTDDLKKSDSNFVYSNLTSCLRSDKSVNATTKNDLMIKAGTSPASVGADPMYDYCTHTDQIGEATADWFASEVITDVISKDHPNLSRKQWQDGFRSTLRPKCDQQQMDENEGFDSHPKLVDRYNGILLSNSNVRKKMGCDKVPQLKLQCSIDTDVTATTSGAGSNTSNKADGKKQTGQEGGQK